MVWIYPALSSTHEALRITREIVYRETAASKWNPCLIGDRVMPRLPDAPDAEGPLLEGELWPAIRDQIFNADADTIGGQLVNIGDYATRRSIWNSDLKIRVHFRNCQRPLDASVSRGAVR